MEEKVKDNNTSFNNTLNNTLDISPNKKKPSKHKYGEYKNVLLTDEELDKLKDEYFDWEERIERLSSYVASTGKKYSSHYATIRNWARKDVQQRQGKADPIKNRVSDVDNW